MAGTLYITATPIGNLGDVTLRALETLRSVGIIACEDTRVTRKLLARYDIRAELVSYHEHNARESGEVIVSRLLAGESAALVSDAGTPVVSDPGESLVALCRESGVPVCAIPGPCAAVSALALSGLPAGRFCFEGFLSMAKKSRREHLESLVSERRTMVFYEAPHKLLATLADFARVFGGERRAVICRELTKLHEETLCLTLDGALAHFTETPPRGEFTLVIDGAAPPPAVETRDALELARAAVAAGVSPRDAARQAAQSTGVSRREIYNQLTMNN
ncbi:MAG: 16S rRNA (cytidine(1402)-2'-O)-methyltransferase [Oscillospiraceae bacterium]|jgi:16S rRNA (cytidine1402-2'-O)-methyltransferase|nr:16S rRNA (cytidine(1402)-2'-O)-methyltransferase [Oscillospiraceae bacterium]